MRVDYALIPSCLCHHIRETQIEDSVEGSDHCPINVILRRELFSTQEVKEPGQDITFGFSRYQIPQVSEATNE